MAGPTDDVVRGNWASDPWGRYPYRWFDGENWSALVFDGTTQHLDPFVTSVRPEMSASTPAPAPAPAPATAAATTVQTTQKSMVSSDPSPAAVDESALSPWAPRSSNGSPESSKPVGPAPTVPPPAAPGADRGDRSDRVAVATATSASARAAGAAGPTPTDGASGDVSSEKKRPVWVPVVGVVMVIGFSWLLYNMRGGDDEFTSPADSATEVTPTLAASNEVSVTTTIAPVTTPPIPSTTAEVASLPPPVVPDATATGLQDCIEFVPAAAFVQLPWAQELWAAAGSDAAGLPAVCAALPPEQLAEIALQRDEQELATTGSTSPPPTTVAAPADSIVPPITSADGSTVPVSPTMPPPLPTTTP